VELKLTPKARADLDAIWDYSAQQWSVEQAEIYLTSLAQTMRLLVENPGLGTKIDHVKSGYKKFPAASHLLIFKVTATAIEIVRVLHKGMDVERQLEK
jgi:toxin ParE1/3/4